jgi:hypothetical protein
VVLLAWLVDRARTSFKNDIPPEQDRQQDEMIQTLHSKHTLGIFRNIAWLAYAVSVHAFADFFSIQEGKAFLQKTHQDDFENLFLKPINKVSILRQQTDEHSQRVSFWLLLPGWKSVDKRPRRERRIVNKSCRIESSDGF